MGLRIVDWGPAHADVVERWARRTWSRPTQDDWFRWRYLDCPNLRGKLALRDDACVAGVFAFERVHRWNGRERTVLETHDWYCDPEFVGSGLGVRVMRALMAAPEPIVAYGGSAATLAILPRLSWQKAGEVTWLQAWLGGPALGERIAARTGVPSPIGAAVGRLGSTALRWASPRHRPRGGQAIDVGAIGPEALAVLAARRRGIVPLPSPAWLRWLSAHPSSGSHLPVYLTVDGQLRGYALGRIHLDDEGRPSAQIVDLAVDDDALYPWAIGELLDRFAGHQPGRVAVHTSVPALRAALRRFGFLPSGVQPIYVWPKDDPMPTQDHRVTTATSDHPLLPYPKTWLTGGA